MTFGERVKQWASDRNLIHGSNPLQQTKKLREEFNEFLDALVDYCNQKRDTDVDAIIHEMKDAIGDTCVVFAVICAQMNIEFEECLEIAWNAIKDRKGRMVDGVFVKEEA